MRVVARPAGGRHFKVLGSGALPATHKRPGENPRGVCWSEAALGGIYRRKICTSPRSGPLLSIPLLTWIRRA